MKRNQSLLVLIIGIIALTVSASYFAQRPSEAVRHVTNESAYDRVLRTGVLRCGYADNPPYWLIKDPKSGKISGVMVDISETVAEKLGLKVEWTEDTGWANFTESLRDARIDVFCGSLFRNAARGRYIGFSVPMFFAPVYGWVAENDHRFDYDYSIVDNPSVRVASIDGRISDIVAKKNFPKAKGFSIPGNSAVSDVFLNVATHKADIVFEPAFNAHGFMLANPKKLRLAQARPFLVFQSCLAVEIHETQLKEMLDSAIIELQDQGIIQQIVAKYSPADSGEYLRVALPYRD